ncbi:MAG TPA: DUF2339 domain-containing protein [Plasticicumulans sp.]|nr:DUF2339 domain-containing protein [Plasticicumulans sp.]
MPLLLSLFLIILGAITGAEATRDDAAGAVLGATLGLTLGLLLALRRRVQRLEARLDAPGTGQPAPAPAEAVRPAAVPARETVWTRAAVEPAAVAQAAAPPPDGWQPGFPQAAIPPGWDTPQSGAAGASLRSRLQDWLAGGNALVRTGIVVLFFGAAFLVRYVAEHSQLSIELRLAALAATGIAGVALGWRLRERRRGYALSLQGGGLGLVYLVLYGAMQFYGLIPPLAGFALLFACTAAGVALAVAQAAEVLGLFAVLGGFLAPVLVSTGSNDHVALFGYYLVLDLGILALLLREPWRRLAVLGFVCTYVIGTLWGGLRYRPELLASTEPFLLAFFGLFSLLPVLAAHRLPPDPKRPLDAGLVFGVPVLTLALQAALLEGVEHGLALSALGCAAWYAALWRFCRQRPALALLGECQAAIALVSATLAVPLYFEAGTSSPLWALEGAGLVWVGARQDRRGLTGFGALLLFAAGALWLDAHLPDMPVSRPFLRADALDTPLLALAALVAAAALGRLRPAPQPLRLETVLAGWGAFWWLLWCLRETAMSTLAVDAASGVWLLFLAASSALAFLAWRRLALGWLRVPLYGLPLLLAPLAMHDFLHRDHPLAGLGAAGWLAAFAVQFGLLRVESSAADAGDRGQRWRYAAAVWLLLALALQEVAWLIGDVVHLAFVWTRAANGVLIAATLALLLDGERPAWPLAAYGTAGRRLAGAPVALLLLAWFPAAGLHGPALPAPLPFVPLLNPVELAAVAALLVLARAGGRPWFVPPAQRPAARTVLAALGFATLNLAVLRACHHLAGVPWSAAALWDSRLVQTALALVWATAAVVLMLTGTRRGQRGIWLAGAGLMALVVLKLFIVDLDGRDTLARILAFLGTGGLLLLVGWLAPVPPRAAPGPSVDTDTDDDAESGPSPTPAAAPVDAPPAS